MGKERAKRTFIGLIFAIIAYEWLVSGLDKLFSGGAFVQGLHDEMMSAIPQMQYRFYARLLSKYCMPHCEVYATLVEAGEIAVGLSFAILTIYYLRNKAHSRVLLKVGITASIVAAFLSLNFFFYQGGSVFINTGDPFDEGIPIDFVMFLFHVAMAVFLYLESRSAKKLAVA